MFITILTDRETCDPSIYLVYISTDTLKTNSLKNICENILFFFNLKPALAQTHERDYYRLLIDRCNIVRYHYSGFGMTLGSIVRVSFFFFIISQSSYSNLILSLYNYTL